jgi:DNA-binding transcriptional ArsR family regulator
MANNARLEAVFAALADPTRRRIVERLARRSLTVGEIAEGFAISQPGISKHVRILETAGLIERTIVGRVHYCALSPRAMEEAARWLEKQRAFWNKALDRLEVVLAEPSTKRT